MNSAVEFVKRNSMPLAKRTNRTKHQVRTEETQSKILDAAGALFSEQGFEKTQLEELGSASTLYSIECYYLNYPYTVVVSMLANHTRICNENSIIIIIQIASVNGT